MSEQIQKSVFPERLRECREKLGVAQQELARLCGFGVNQINRYETGTQEPSLTAIDKISDVLGVSIDYLVGKVDQPRGEIAHSELNVFERELVDIYRREGWAGVMRLGVEKLSKYLAQIT